MDTIVAISTPSGVGGIAVVRLSGDGSFGIAAKHVSVPSDVAYGVRPTTFFGTFRDGDDVVDEVVVTMFKSPHSYTGEDTVEVSCHGSLYVQQAILQALVDSGARVAERGEFTQRAFLNGRLNLSQAEAVADLIDAVTPQQHRLAVSQLRGSYAEELKHMRQQLLELASLLELELDFSEEDVEFADRSRLLGLVETLSIGITTLCGTFHLGNALKQGVPVAIIGRPNAGKSSLLNALLGDDRAIVSPIAGTTRDTVEETVNIDGITFRFIDTAGLHNTDDMLEKMGIERSITAARQADIILYVHDATLSWLDAIADLQTLRDIIGVPLNEKHLWVVNNKMDLPEAIATTSKLGIAVSSTQGTGLDELRSNMVKAVNNDMASASDTLLSNARHYDALCRTDKSLFHVAKGLKEGIPADLVAIDLREALYHLGTITGEVTNNEVLGTIFSRFCVGK